MADYIVENRLYIIGADKVLTLQPGVGAGTAIQSNSGSWASSVFQPVRQGCCGRPQVDVSP